MAKSKKPKQPPKQSMPPKMPKGYSSPAADIPMPEKFNPSKLVK